MSRLSAIEPASASAAAKALLERIWEETGIVPALVRVMAHSPAVLGGYLSIQDHLDAGTLYDRLRYQVAPAVSQANGSDYCVGPPTRRSARQPD